ncbi:MAG: ATP-binding protein [bacterium]|nr:ATP-binding protein [bacterium]
MTGVSARLVDVVLSAAEQRGIDTSVRVRELGVSPEPRRKPFARIEWDAFASLCEFIAAALGSDDAVIDFGECVAPSESMPVFRLLGLVVTDPIDQYEIGARWLGPSLMPMIEGRVEVLPDGVIVERLRMLESHRECRAVMLMLCGYFRASPTVWGAPRAEVRVDLVPGGADYAIRAPRRAKGRISRLVDRIRGRAALQTVLRELEGQHWDINDSYREVRAAHDRIALQARALARVNEIGAALSQQIDLDHVATTLGRVLTDDLDFTGAEIEIRLDDPDPSESVAENAAPHEQRPRYRRSFGETGGEPSHRHALENASGPFGRLTLWREADAAAISGDLEPTGSMLLRRLLPWIAIALDNARAYRRLEDHADQLEQRVRERTASLISANHHLVREVEERRRATEALDESEAQLRASERLASVGTLAAGIAHEINNPIGSILAAAQFAQVLENDEGSRAEIDQALEDIVREAKRCGGIVKSVLQFARDERTDKWDCRLEEILRRTARLAQPETEAEGAQLELHLPPAPVWVHVNPIQIEQALLNLIRNALEAGGAHVHVRVDADDERGLARVQIDDDGPGIPEAERVRIFEPFYTTRREEGGTGLGLSVVHGIAREHGGQLKVESNAAGGLAVLLELPRVQGPAVALEDKLEERREDRRDGVVTEPGPKG